MSDRSDTTINLSALGVLIRRLQVDVSAMSVKLDLLSRARERDLGTFATHDDLRDVTTVLAERIADFDLRISGAVAQVAEQMAALPAMDARLDDLAQSQQRIEVALDAIAARLP